jgi:hypothetical protein
VIQQKDIDGLTGFKRKKPEIPARFTPPQGDDQNFIKFIADRILRYIAITGCICVFSHGLDCTIGKLIVKKKDPNMPTIGFISKLIKISKNTFTKHTTNFKTIVFSICTKMKSG